MVKLSCFRATGGVTSWNWVSEKPKRISKRKSKGRHWRYSTRSEYAHDVRYLVEEYELIRYAAFKPHTSGTMEFYIQTVKPITARQVKKLFDYPIYNITRLSKQDIPTDYTDSSGVFVTQGKRNKAVVV